MPSPQLRADHQGRGCGHHAPEAPDAARIQHVSRSSVLGSQPGTPGRTVRPSCMWNHRHDLQLLLLTFSRRFPYGHLVGWQPSATACMREGEEDMLPPRLPGGVSMTSLSLAHPTSQSPKADIPQGAPRGHLMKPMVSATPGPLTSSPCSSTPLLPGQETRRSSGTATTGTSRARAPPPSGTLCPSTFLLFYLFSFHPSLPWLSVNPSIPHTPIPHTPSLSHVGPGSREPYAHMTKHHFGYCKLLGRKSGGGGQ